MSRRIETRVLAAVAGALLAAAPLATVSYAQDRPPGCLQPRPVRAVLPPAGADEPLPPIEEQLLSGERRRAVLPPGYLPCAPVRGSAADTATAGGEDPDAGGEAASQPPSESPTGYPNVRASRALERRLEPSGAFPIVESDGTGDPDRPCRRRNPC